MLILITKTKILGLKSYILSPILSMNHYEYNWYRNAKNCDTFTANWSKGSIENFEHGS